VLDANLESSLRNLLRFVFSHDYDQPSHHHASAALLEASETNSKHRNLSKKRSSSPSPSRQAFLRPRNRLDNWDKYGLGSYSLTRPYSHDGLKLLLSVPLGSTNFSSNRHCHKLQLLHLFYHILYTITTHHGYLLTVQGKSCLLGMHVRRTLISYPPRHPITPLWFHTV
jgi:hypothetical protein